MTIIKSTQTEFHRHLTERLSRVRTPFSGTFELTPRCNFDCGHCYLGDRHGDNAPLSTDEIAAILQQLASAGCLTIGFTGGEPLLRDDYLEIHRAAHTGGFLVSLLTNGAMIDDRIADHLSAFPPRVVEISLYGGDEETYRIVTGRSGAFQRVSDGIDRLLKRRIQVLLKTVLLDTIVDRYDALARFAASRGLSVLCDPSVTPTIDSNPSPIALRGNASAAVNIEFSAQDRRERLEKYHQTISELQPVNGAPTCGAGFSGFHIDYRGNLMSCLMLREPCFNLRETSFSEAWAALGQSARPAFPPESKCAQCDIKHLCGYCPGALYCGERPPEGMNDFYCQVALARFEKMHS